MKETFASALCKLQADLKTISINKTADMGKFKSNYASYDHVLDSVRPHLIKHGFAVTSKSCFMDGRLVLLVRLIHSSGEEEDTALPLNASGNPQALGSELSYMKRYGLGLVLGLAYAEEDDGGKAAAHAASEARSSQGAAAGKPRRSAPPKSDDDATRRARHLWAQVNATAKAVGLNKSEGEDLLREKIISAFGEEISTKLLDQEQHDFLIAELKALEKSNTPPRDE